MASLLHRFRRHRSNSTPTPPQEDAAITKESSTGGPAASPQHDPEKHDPEIAVSSDAQWTEENESALPEDVRELPKIVRSTVSLEDDPNAPTLTFRYFLLCFIFIPPGAILFQMGSFRTTAAVYPVLFVQIGKQECEKGKAE